MMSERDLEDRLSAAYTIEVDPETRERHLAETGIAIRTAPSVPVRAGFGLRRRVAAVLAAIFFVAPAGVALAAESAVPGDFLYPVKEITERVRSYVDRDIEATHRVEEVERLVFRRAPAHAVARAVERAESATLQLEESGDLRVRLERAQERRQELDDERRPVDEGGFGEDRKESDSESGRTGTDAGSDNSVPSGPRGSTEQNEEGSGTTGATPGQGSGDGDGAMVGSGEGSPTTAPSNAGGSSHP